MAAVGVLGACARAHGAQDAASPVGERLWLFAGKLHPLAVHFPIALLVAGLALEFLRSRRGLRTPGAAAFACVALGAIGAVIAAAMGWSDAESTGHGGADAGTLLAHRWIGVGCATAALLAALLGALARSRNARLPFAWYRAMLVLAAASVAVTGHLGGSLVYGDDYVENAIALLSSTDREDSQRPVRVTLGAAPDFDREVRPIFARRCLQCHSGAEPASALALDSRSAMLKGGESGRAAIVPGDAAGSRLIELVSSTGKLRMPPKGAPLDAGDVEILRSWIDHGASFSSTSEGPWHWAYRAPVRPNPPPVKDTSWARNPIDQFVLARLEAEGLRPSAQAALETLIRRVSLDLTGLPPTVQEIDDFVNDARPGAYERLVDRLLASPRYGERMARPWLDLARYADTHGYEKDNRRVAWPFRDWVIEAFNRDEPFDQFSTDQLAGDLIPGRTRAQLIATGFHRNTMINEEGGVDPEEFRAETIIDRVNTTGATWLGLTVACAQCHDHKFDPITQKDYYRLFAFFNSCEADTRPHQFGVDAAGAMVTVPTRGREVEYDRCVEELAAVEARYEADSAELTAAQDAWEREFASVLDAWRIVPIVDASSSGGAAFTVRSDGSVSASGSNAEKDTFDLTLGGDLSGAAWVRLELLADEGTPGIGRNPADANVVVSELSLVRSLGPGAGGARGSLRFTDALADFEQAAGGPWKAGHAVDGDPKTGWALAPESGISHAAVFRLAEPIESAEGAVYTLSITNAYGSHLNPAHVRVSVLTGAASREAVLVPRAIAESLATARGTRTESQQRSLRDHFRSVTPLLSDTRSRRAALRMQRDSLVAAQAMVLKELDTPRETHIFVRGSFMSPGERVEAGVPSVLPQIPAGERADRLALAKWLFDPANPLTARVAVNRLWELHFGRGLVETSEDFGTQGEPPTHPELLDWLATEFMRQGWSMKAMHRLIVTSATYMQSSRVTPELLERDPSNKLLARGSRFRVEAETIRDIALEASGLLSSKLGGPSVFPPQPDGTWTMIYNSDQWVESTGEDKYRRGLYTFWRRTAPYPTFVAFDAPSREIACTRRPRTNTPLQALTTLNDPQFVEAAGALARRMLSEAGPAIEDRVALGFRLCTARRPNEHELERLGSLYRHTLDVYGESPTDAAELAAAGPGGKGYAYDEPEVAAMTVVANVLLNLDETLTRE